MFTNKILDWYYNSFFYDFYMSFYHWLHREEHEQEYKEMMRECADDAKDRNEAEMFKAWRENFPEEQKKWVENGKPNILIY